MDNVKLDTKVTSTERRINMRAGRVQSVTEVLVEMGYLAPDDGKMYDV